METRPGYSAKEPMPEDAVPPTQSGVPPKNGNRAATHIPIISDGIRARVIHVQAEIGVQLLNEEGDNLRQISYKFPEPIPRADPERKSRTIGERIDEAIAEAEQRAVRDYEKAREEAAGAAR